MGSLSLPLAAFYAIVTAIPVGAWLRWEFRPRFRLANSIWGHLKEILVLVIITLLGLLTASLFYSFSFLFAGLDWRVATATVGFALIPVCIWFHLVYKERMRQLETDREKRREKWILLVIFLLGALTVPLLKLYYEYLQSHPQFDYYAQLSTKLVGSDGDDHVYRTVTIIIDALLEEIVKISLMLFFVRLMKLVRTIGDAISFSVLAGLGFAFMENIVYFITVYTDPSNTFLTFVNVVIFRTIVLNVGHMTFSGIFGYFYGLSKFALPVSEEQWWEGQKFPLFNIFSKIFRQPMYAIFSMALVYEGLVLAMTTHATFNSFLEFNLRDYAVYLIIGTSLYVYYLTQRRAGHLVLAALGRHRMSLMAPRDENVVLELAGMWINEGKYKEVEEICDRLEEKDPDNAVVKLLYAKAHDKRRIARAMLALKSLFFQEDIFEDDVSLFKRFAQIKEERGEWKKRDTTEAKGPKGPQLPLV